MNEAVYIVGGIGAIVLVCYYFLLHRLCVIESKLDLMLGYVESPDKQP